MQKAFTAAVTLSAFYTTLSQGQVLVNWQTVFEIDLLGFNIYRSISPDGPRTQVNGELILGQGLGGAPGETNFGASLYLPLLFN
jgi:hypothetical protein